MTELSEWDVGDILGDVSDEYKLVTYTIEDQDDWFCSYLYVFLYEGKLYGFDLQIPTGQHESWTDINQFPIKCFEVEVDPTPRYRRKKND